MREADARRGFFVPQSENPELDLREAVADGHRWPEPEAQTLCPDFDMVPQLRLALLDSVSDFAAIERRKSWARELLPSVSLGCHQGIKSRPKASISFMLSTGVGKKVASVLSLIP
jgi:hypothetical protein